MPVAAKRNLCSIPVRCTQGIAGSVTLRLPEPSAVHPGPYAMDAPGPSNCRNYRSQGRLFNSQSSARKDFSEPFFVNALPHATHIRGDLPHLLHYRHNAALLAWQANQFSPNIGGVLIVTYSATLVFQNSPTPTFTGPIPYPRIVRHGPFLSGW